MLLRVCFAVKGNIKFLSHLDLLKIMERALRRAELPVAFSQGFNPHPKIAFGSAKSVGLASLCEYFDLELAKEMEMTDFQTRLQEKLPQGIEIKGVQEISPEDPALMAVINCAHYQVLVKVSGGVTPEELDQKIEALFAQTEIIVERVSPKKKKSFDIRPGIVELSYLFKTSDRVEFEMELRMGNLGNVRPSEVIDALKLEDYQILDITRIGLFIKQDSGEKVLPS